MYPLKQQRIWIETRLEDLDKSLEVEEGLLGAFEANARWRRDLILRYQELDLATEGGRLDEWETEASH